MLELLGQNFSTISPHENSYGVSIATADDKKTPGDYYFRDKGIRIRTDNEHKITAVLFYNEERNESGEGLEKFLTGYSAAEAARFKKFQGKLPFGLDFSLTEADARRKLGRPYDTNATFKYAGEAADFKRMGLKIPLPATDRFIFKEYKVEVEYNVRLDRIMAQFPSIKCIAVSKK